MLNKILKGKALEEYINEEFELKVFKSKGMDKPGLRYKGSQHGLLAAYSQLVEIALKEEVIPAKILHALLMVIADDLGQVTCEDESK